MVTLSSPSTPSPSPQSCSPAGPPQPVLVPGVVPPQGQDPALALVEPHQVPLCPALQPGQVTLNGSTACQCIHHTSQFGVISKLALGLEQGGFCSPWSVARVWVMAISSCVWAGGLWHHEMEEAGRAGQLVEVGSRGGPRQLTPAKLARRCGLPWQRLRDGWTGSPALTGVCRRYPAAVADGAASSVTRRSGSLWVPIPAGASLRRPGRAALLPAPSRRNHRAWWGWVCSDAGGDNARKAPQNAAAAWDGSVPLRPSRGFALAQG